MSNCSGSCCTCVCNECCLAVNGDDDYTLASLEVLEERLVSPNYSKNTNEIRKAILNYYVNGSEVKVHFEGTCTINLPDLIISKINNDTLSLAEKSMLWNKLTKADFKIDIVKGDAE